MYVLGVDFETTGLAESQDVVTEIGAVLWDWEAKMPVLMMDELVELPENAGINPIVVEMNGITEELLRGFGSNASAAFENLNKMGEKADYVMAHNAEFDMRFYNASMKRTGLEPALSAKTWLDSAADVNYPKSIKTRKLVFLAAEHNFLNPFAHRAVFDVLTMFNVVKDYNIQNIIKYASEEKYELKAEVTFNEKQKAKDRGFHWDSENRIWVKTVRESKIKGESRACDFDLFSRKKGKEKDWKKVNPVKKKPRTKSS